MRELTFDQIETVDGQGVVDAFLVGAGAGGFAGALAGSAAAGVGAAPGATLGALAGGGIAVFLYYL